MKQEESSPLALLKHYRERDIVIARVSRIPLERWKFDGKIGYENRPLHDWSKADPNQPYHIPTSYQITVQGLSVEVGLQVITMPEEMERGETDLGITRLIVREGNVELYRWREEVSYFKRMYVEQRFEHRLLIVARLESVQKDESKEKPVTCLFYSLTKRYLTRGKKIEEARERANLEKIVETFSPKKE